MSIGLIGRKVGMTQVFQDDGTMVAVSVVEIEPNTVTRLRTEERDGYSAVQIGTDARARLTKPEAGDLVDISGVSKGKGFAGHVKRHHFNRGPKSHGSDHHREPGSIGPGTTPGRVYKGLRMAGHMGDERTTIKKMRVVRTDSERNLLLVAGSLPGARGALILVKKA
jgi:large subunit ribosomal protein L3